MPTPLSDSSPTAREPVVNTVRIGIDVGGTFTDFVLHDPPARTSLTDKRLTTTQSPARGVLEGIRCLLSRTGNTFEQIESVVHGTTMVTNTLLERTGATIGLLTTAGFRDLVEMGREIRYDVDDLTARPAPVLVPRHRRFEIPERILFDGRQQSPLDEGAVLGAVRSLVEDHRVEAIAVAFLHSYANPVHEQRSAELISSEYPHLPVTLSSQVASERGEYERTITACVNAYTQPQMIEYLDNLSEALRAEGFAGNIRIMLSSGGIATTDHAKAFPAHLLESGPAAGVMAAAHLARLTQQHAVLSFDMGGTTAKMALIEAGAPHLARTFEAARVAKFKPGSGLPLKLTVIDMIEIGAGGGSIAYVDNAGLMKVGPRSAGSYPGPIAYGRGGTTPTITDADLTLGHLEPTAFLGGDMVLETDGVDQAIADQLALPLNIATRAAAAGIVDIAVESMAAATRAQMAESGNDPRTFTLLAFGGAGPVHAYELAKRLKMTKIIVPVGAGVMSALGLLVAPPAVDIVRCHAAPLEHIDWATIGSLYDEMTASATELLSAAGELPAGIRFTRSADMRYVGQGFEVEVTLPERILDSNPGLVADRFADAYRSKFGRTVTGIQIEVINWRLSARLPETPVYLTHPATGGETAPRGTRKVQFLEVGEVEAVVYDRDRLSRGMTIRGPAVIEERETTFAVGPDCILEVDDHFNLVATIGSEAGERIHLGNGASTSRRSLADPERNAIGTSVQQRQ